MGDKWLEYRITINFSGNWREMPRHLQNIKQIYADGTQISVCITQFQNEMGDLQPRHATSNRGKNDKL
jgi:hypothetical protein